MDEAFKAMDHTILSTFGQSVLLTLSDQSTLETQGIITHELVELGQYEAVSGEITVLSVDSSIKLKRGDRAKLPLMVGSGLNIKNIYFIPCRYKNSVENIFKE